MFLKRKLERDLEDEIRSHLEMQIEDNLRLGMSPEEARYEALRKFGGVEQVKESYRDRSSLSFVDSTLQDLRYGLRMLWKAKASPRGRAFAGAGHRSEYGDLQSD